ncbi:hypothetical protein [Streptomyces angustmyceticus]|uniref:hypothetical protein n=1 Tax=Streptomyces angustmyceticus TaxID=285578 RepID=UPI003D8DDD50
MTGFRARYGASPLHLLLVGCSFAVTVYAGVRLLQGDTVGIVVWFVGAALLHDLVFLPLYTVTDRLAQRLARHRRRDGEDAGPVVAGGINYLRVPAFVALLLFLVWYPLILRRVPEFTRHTALPSGGFLGRWLLITATLFAASAVCLLVALWRQGRTAGGRPEGLPPPDAPPAQPPPAAPPAPPSPPPAPAAPPEAGPPPPPPPAPSPQSPPPASHEPGE